MTGVIRGTYDAHGCHKIMTDDKNMNVQDVTQGLMLGFNNESS